MSQQITISKCRVRAEVLWRVRWHELGRVRRKFFGGRASADSFAAFLRGEELTARQRMLALPEREIQILMAAHDDAKKRGVDILSAIAAATPTVATSPTASTVLAEMEAAKRKAGRDESYLASLTAIVRELIGGRESVPVDLFTVRDVEIYMESKKIRSRSTLRSRLSTYFEWAVRRGYRTANPCSQLEAVTPPHVAPQILTVDETARALEWLKGNPRLMAWFVLSTFAGLRPEEAEKTTWKEINLDEGFIRVEAQTSKVRQRRVVYPMPMALEWLRFAKRKKSQLPLSTKQRTTARNELRDVLGWPVWKQDVTRHSCASYWLAHCGSAAAVATALGHSENVLRKNYMALVTKADAIKFWGCGTPHPSTPRQLA